MPLPPLSIDIFCHVIDFYGDIGVSWRLARQLHYDLGCQVRFIVDDFTTLHTIVPGIDPSAALQVYDGVTILLWQDQTLRQHYTTTADAVIEALACTLPDFVHEMIARSRPIWIDLEYLSAEAWVEGCHGIPSLHPMTGVEKTLFFPGFTQKTGGLTREHDLIARRDAFVGDTAAQNQWRERNDLPPLQDGVTDISLFCYRNAPFRTLLDSIRRSKLKPRLFVTAGVDRQAFNEALREVSLPLSASVHFVRFLSQDDYDHLLWTSSINFVRGEDSFVRAIWAGKPLVWHIYPQEKVAHTVKLLAFLRLYSAHLAPDYAQALENFTILWNLRGREEEDHPSLQDPDWISVLVEISSRRAGTASELQTWSSSMIQHQDLASQLINFIRQQLMKERGITP